MVVLNTSLTLSVSVVASVSLSFGFVLVLLLCVPCLRKKRGFSNFSNSTTSLENDQGEVNDSFTLTIDDANGDLSRSTSVTIDPLPDITSKLGLSGTPHRPQISSLGKARQDASLKLTVHHPFPRNQIVYLKELGTGWFGKVIESDAERITVGAPRSKVVVKVLKDDASREEKDLFFDEVAPFRLLEHSNIIRLLGQCTESAPLLMIMEAAAYGNLKQYLCSHRQNEALLIQKNRLMQFALDASCGLACLHRHDYLHRDLAARNCLVMSDYTLKIGDYGIADHLYKEDYYLSGSRLLPIRWMAPEMLKQENGHWTSNSFTKDSDIWALGVVLWEIATLGEQPYGRLSDEEVLHKVVVHREVRLPEPHILMPCKDRLYELMESCWRDKPQRMQVDEVHGLLQAITSMALGSGDPTSTFDQKWAQMTPNQHHWSADSIDSQITSAARGDASFLSDLSGPDSLDDLIATELHPENSVHTTAIVHTSGGGMDSGIHVGQTDFIDRDGSPGFVVAADDSLTNTFHLDSSSSSTLPTDFVNGLESSQTDMFSAGLDFAVNGHGPSGSENSSSGFDVLESAAELDLADEKSVSDSIGTFQSSATGDISMEKDSSSCEFVVINDSKDVTASSPSSANPPVFSASLSVPPSENVVPSNASPSPVSPSHSIKTSETSEPSDANAATTSFGTELSSLSSLVVQQPSLSSEPEQSFPSLGTDLSSLSSLSVPLPEPPSTADPCDEGTVSGTSAAVCEDVRESSSSLQALNDFQFETLTSLTEADDNHIRETEEEEELPPTQNKDAVPEPIEAVSDGDGDFRSEDVEQGQRIECEAVCTTKEEEEEAEGHVEPAGLEKEESVCEDSVVSASDRVDGVHSTGTDHSPLSPNSVSLFMDASNGFSSAASSEKSPEDPSTPSHSEEMLQQLTSASSKLLSAVSKDSDSLAAAGGSSAEGESGSDSESSTNSDSGRDYICDQSWDGQGHSSMPLSSSPSSMDSEEYALQIASEIYLSKGLKMGRPFESTVLEPIPEDPLPSISEESVAPVPSESSSVDVKFDEVFEWDDFMGEPLVGKDQTSPEAGSPRESFDMSDWMMDMESDGLPSAPSSLTSQHSDTPHKEAGMSDLRNTAPSDSSSSFNRSSASSDSESGSGNRSRNHRSYISDLLSNRTKGVNSHSLGPSKFYSLYEEEFDLESDSQSEGGGSPPGSGFVLGSQGVGQGAARDTSFYAEHHAPHLSSSLQADESVHPSEKDFENDRHGGDSSDESVETDPPPLD